MCQVSKKIKFCTCNVEDINDLEHFWIFYSFQEDQEIMMIGQPLFPKDIDLANETVNRKLLLKRMNELDAFEIDLNPKEKDRFRVAIHCPSTNVHRYLDYGFEWRKGKWVRKDFEDFDWARKHSEEKFGEVQNAID